MPTTHTARKPTDRWFVKRYLEHPLKVGAYRLEQVMDRIGEGQEAFAAGAEAVYCVVYSVTGSFELACEDGADAILVPGRHFTVIPPGIAWRSTSRVLGDVGPGRMLIVQLRQEVPSRMERELGAALLPKVIHDTLGMEEMLLSLLAELDRQDRFTTRMAESYVLQMLVMLQRSAMEVSVVEEKPRTLSKKELAYQCLQYIDHRLLEIRELSDVAEGLGYSYSYLSHVFRSEMGLPLQAYWTRRRIMKAMSWLQTGQMKGTEIAEKLHYHSIHSFSKAFKKGAGLTPSDYQELYGRK